MGHGRPGFPRGFSCPVVLGNIAREPLTFRLRGYHPLWRPVPRPSARQVVCNSPDPPQRIQARPATPTWQRLRAIAPDWFGLFRVRSPLLAESLLFSVPAGTEMVHFPALSSTRLCIQRGIPQHDSRWVAPFGHLRVEACLQLTEAFRSLPRPSSTSGAKAFTVHP